MTAGTPTNIAVALTPLSTATLTGSVSALPSGAATAKIHVALKHPADPFGIYVGDTTNTSGSYSVITPSASGSVSVNVIAEASTQSAGINAIYKQWKANTPSNATNVSFVFGTAPVLSTPANLAAGVGSGATFSWSPGAPTGMYMLHIACGTTYAASIFTTETSVKLHDTSDLDAAWPVMKNCSWYVSLYGTAGAVDAAVASNARNKLDAPNGPVDGSRTDITGYSFTTQ